jgi:hypothetical protein
MTSFSRYTASRACCAALILSIGLLPPQAAFAAAPPPPPPPPPVNNKVVLPPPTTGKTTITPNTTSTNNTTKNTTTSTTNKTIQKDTATVTKDKQTVTKQQTIIQNDQSKVQSAVKSDNKAAVTNAHNQLDKDLTILKTDTQAEQKAQQALAAALVPRAPAGTQVAVTPANSGSTTITVTNSNGTPASAAVQLAAMQGMLGLSTALGAPVAGTTTPTSQPPPSSTQPDAVVTNPTTVNSAAPSKDTSVLAAPATNPIAITGPSVISTPSATSTPATSTTATPAAGSSTTPGTSTPNPAGTTPAAPIIFNLTGNIVIQAAPPAWQTTVPPPKLLPLSNNLPASVKPTTNANGVVQYPLPPTSNTTAGNGTSYTSISTSKTTAVAAWNAYYQKQDAQLPTAQLQSKLATLKPTDPEYVVVQNQLAVNKQMAAQYTDDSKLSPADQVLRINSLPTNSPERTVLQLMVVNEETQTYSTESTATLQQQLKTFGPSDIETSIITNVLTTQYAAQYKSASLTTLLGVINNKSLPAYQVAAAQSAYNAQVSKYTFPAIAVVTPPPPPPKSSNCGGDNFLCWAQGQAADLPTGLKIAGTILVVATVGIMLMPVAAPAALLILPGVAATVAVGSAVTGSGVTLAVAVVGIGGGAAIGTGAGAELVGLSQFLNFTY